MTKWRLTSEPHIKDPDFMRYHIERRIFGVWWRYTSLLLINDIDGEPADARALDWFARVTGKPTEPRVVEER